MNTTEQVIFFAAGALTMVLGGIGLVSALGRQRAPVSSRGIVRPKTRLYFVLVGAGIAIVLLVVSNLLHW